MEDCSFEKLMLLLDKKLSLNAQLRVFQHLEGCDICRDTLYHISRDRDEEAGLLSVRRKKTASRRIASQKTAPAVATTLLKADPDVAASRATGTEG